LTQIQNIYGTINNSQSTNNTDFSITNLMSGLQQSLITLSSNPNNIGALQSVADSASQLTTIINTSADTIDQISDNIKSSSSDYITQINNDLQNLDNVNKQLSIENFKNSDDTDYVNQQNQILNDLSNYINFSKTIDKNGAVKIFLPNGISLLDNGPSHISMTSFNNKIVFSVNSLSIPIDNGTFNGKLGGSFELYNNILPNLKNQLNVISYNLINNFSETPTTTNINLKAPGLFTYSDSPLVPSTSVKDLSNLLKVNKQLSNANNLNYIVNGGFGGSDYVNSNIDVSSQVNRVNNIINSFTSISNSTLNSPSNLIDYSTNMLTSLGSLISNNQQELTNTQNQNNTIAQMINSESGVNIDKEMTQMLDLEHAYQASAKLLSVISDLFNTLVQAT
jgi:flagellar hook-associated protein 1